VPVESLRLHHWVYGHFGPKTLRTQDILALVPSVLWTLWHQCKKIDTRHFGTSAEMSWTLQP